MVRELQLNDREEAVAIGETLMFRGIIAHVCNSEPFVDGMIFYRFTQDRDGKEKTQSSCFILKVPTLWFTENEVCFLIHKKCSHTISKNKDY
jgi:hypothetical protein